jgi:hypothetical protein
LGAKRSVLSEGFSYKGMEIEASRWCIMDEGAGLSKKNPSRKE